jgi:hypothetical protein
MLTNLYPFLVAILYKTMADEVNSVIRHQKWMFQGTGIHDIQVLLTRNISETFIYISTVKLLQQVHKLYYKPNLHLKIIIIVLAKSVNSYE